MNRSPFTSLLLPAILTSTTTFVVLTLTLVPQIVRSVNVQSSRSEAEVPQPVLVGDGRSLAVRYVGMALMISVGAGLATFEMIRKWQALQDSALKRAEDLGLLQCLEEPIDPLESLWPEASLESASTIWLSAPPNHENQDAAARMFSAIDQALEDATPILILESDQDYQTCRIHVPDSDQRVLAIWMPNQYYRFVSTAHTREQAVQRAEWLHDNAQHSLITRTKRGYAVWQWEPDAVPDA